MSKFIFSLFLTIFIVYINCQYGTTCYDKRQPGYDYYTGTNVNYGTRIYGGSGRSVWHGIYSCNNLPCLNNQWCCYIHIKYQSTLDDNRYDKYGCIGVDSPFADWGGTHNNVKDRVEDVKNDFIMAFINNTEKSIAKNVHVSIICSSSFLKFSAFALLAIILF